MELRLIRREAKKDRTLGELYIGKEKVCDTLEPTYRGFGEKPGVIKVPGKTAIPAGRYAVRVTPSPKFKGKWLPVLCRVPGFSGSASMRATAPPTPLAASSWAHAQRVATSLSSHGWRPILWRLACYRRKMPGN